MNVLKEALHGHVLTAVEKIWDTVWGALPPELQALIESLTDDEGKILWAAAQTALADGLAGKTITQIADDIWPTIETQVPNKAKDDLLNALGVILHAPQQTTPAT